MTLNEFLFQISLSGGRTCQVKVYESDGGSLVLVAKYGHWETME